MASPMQPVSDQRWHRGSDRVLGGVASGLAAGFHVDVIWVRIVFVLLALLQGAGVLIYVLLWLIMPERVEGQSQSRAGFQPMVNDVARIWRDLWAEPRPASAAVGQTNVFPTALRSPSVLIGLTLVVIGGIALAGNLGLVTWDVFWPAVLILIGVLLIIRNLSRRP